MESATWTQKPNRSWRGYIIFKKDNGKEKNEEVVESTWYNPFSWF